MNVTACPQCGAPSSPQDRSCSFCKAPFTVRSILTLDKFGKPTIDKYVAHFKDLQKANPDDGDANFALGLCYLQLKLFPLAIKCLERSVELMPDVPDVYYYLAIAYLKGRRPRMLTLGEIRRIEELVNTATQLDDTRAKYDILSAMLKFDYYRVNGLRIPPPTDDDLLEQAKQKPADAGEINLLIQYVPIKDEVFSRRLAGV